MTKNIILLFTIIILLANCETWRSECGGEIVVKNQIPDTTLYLEGENFFRDLFANPIVLEQTEDQNITLTVLADDGTIVDAIPARSPTTGRLNAVEVIPLEEGDTGIEILASDGCDEVEINFNVTVKDTTNS